MAWNKETKPYIYTSFVELKIGVKKKKIRRGQIIKIPEKTPKKPYL